MNYCICVHNNIISKQKTTLASKRQYSATAQLHLYSAAQLELDPEMSLYMQSSSTPSTAYLCSHSLTDNGWWQTFVICLNVDEEQLEWACIVFWHAHWSYLVLRTLQGMAVWLVRTFCSKKVLLCKLAPRMYSAKLWASSEHADEKVQLKCQELLHLGIPF